MGSHIDGSEQKFSEAGQVVECNGRVSAFRRTDSVPSVWPGKGREALERAKPEFSYARGVRQCVLGCWEAPGDKSTRSHREQQADISEVLGPEGSSPRHHSD